MVSDQFIHDFLVTVIKLVALGYLLRFLVRRLGRTRPGLSIGVPLAVAFLLRVLAAAAVGQLSVAGDLRGGDELIFLGQAHTVAASPLGSAAWTHVLTRELHVFVFAAQLLVFNPPDIALRISQAAISVAGLALLAAAVYELAGARAARITAWLLALEPTNVFFSTLLHKEPNMMLASGLVAFGGAMMWKRAELRSMAPIIVGCLIAVATRTYAGWFLIAAGAAITLHAGIRARRVTSARSLVLVGVVIVFSAIAAPTVWQASSSENLRTLQGSQNANTSAQSVNLSLEQVNFSTRGAIITNLPKRVFDILTKPYPWQVGSVSQQFGVLGTTVFWITLFLLLQGLWENRGRIMERAGPLIYLAFFLLIAYALSAGNAGTSFRYRTHIVALALCLVVVLRLAHEPRFVRTRGDRGRPRRTYQTAPAG
jgi:hypothetical protein